MHGAGFVAVAIGGAAGASLRYAFALLARMLPVTVPYGTLAANVAGCFIVGAFSGMISQRLLLAAELRLLLITGFCGGFTTMSSFMYEMFQYIRDGEWWYGAFYGLATLGGSLGATVIGFILGQAIFKA